MLELDLPYRIEDVKEVVSNVSRFEYYLKRFNWNC